MAGILDSKSRIMDVVITEQGRRQIASGQMRVEYATFTDLGSFYSGDESGVIDDPTTRLYFEAASDLPSDMITFETDDSGFLVPYRADSFGASGKNLVISGSLRDKKQGSAAASSISQAVLESWGNLQVIGTVDPLDDLQGFQLSRQEIAFSIFDNFPFTQNDVKVAVVDDIEGLNHDVRLSKLDNFKYLPPINSTGELAGRSIGDFPNLNESTDREVQAFEARLSLLERSDVEFIETSIENNFLMQVFELSEDDGMLKLDVIDYGMRLSTSDKSKMVRTLFAGKIFIDGFGNPTFVNIFTIELE
jgi:hypothetical protein